jgi:hypothetical protein
MRATFAERSKEFASERRSQSWGDFHLISAAAIAARRPMCRKYPARITSSPMRRILRACVSLKYAGSGNTVPQRGTDEAFISTAAPMCAQSQGRARDSTTSREACLPAVRGGRRPDAAGGAAGQSTPGCDAAVVQAQQLTRTSRAVLTRGYRAAPIGHVPCSRISPCLRRR